MEKHFKKSTLCVGAGYVGELTMAMIQAKYLCHRSLLN